MIDGFYGSLIDKDTNTFNGMIGMLQRQVNINLSCIRILHRICDVKDKTFVLNYI